MPQAAAAQPRQRPGHVLAVTVLALPLLISTMALIPAFVICPFLGAGRQRMVIRPLASLRQWAAALAGPGSAG
jgi:hypothetical protein